MSAGSKPLSAGAVMVVEDEPLIALQLEDLLAALGCTEMHTAARVDHAHQILDQLTPDIALLDLSLDGVMIFPVAERLDALNVPFIIVTGQDETAVPKKWLRQLVMKPYDPSALGHLIERLVEARQALRDRTIAPDLK